MHEKLEGLGEGIKVGFEGKGNGGIRKVFVVVGF